MLKRSQRHSQRPQSVHKNDTFIERVFFFLIQKKALYRGCDHVHYSWVNIPGEVETTDIPTHSTFTHIFTQTQAHTPPQSHLGRETPRVAAHRNATSVLTNRFSQGHNHTAHIVVSTLPDSLIQALSFLRRDKHLLRCLGEGP